MIRFDQKRRLSAKTIAQWPSHINAPPWKTLSQVALIGASLLVLSGCQTLLLKSSTPSSFSQDPLTPIDFSQANQASVNAQRNAFLEQLPKNTASYQALFANNQAIKSEQQAKLRLLAAMNQHLTRPHWSSSQVRYHGSPFVSEGSIDQGADSIFKSLLDLYIYRLTKSIESLEPEDDDAEQVVEMIAQEGDIDDDVNEVALDAPADDYDESLGDDDGDYNRGIFGMSNLNPFQILQDYAEMRNQESAERANAVEGFPNFFSMLKRTPEQINAKNEYQNQYFSVNTLSHFDPKNKQIQSVLSYDYLAPTASSSIQLPIAMDFGNNRFRVDPAAMMPIVALISPDEAFLPEQLGEQTVDFYLADNLRGNVPTGVIYDAVISAFLASMGEIDAASFTPMDIGDDDFAKEIGAVRAVKIDFDSKQSGATLARMFKQITKSLNDYVKANPENTDENAALQEILAKIELYNQGYQSTDVGSLFQLIEAIAPIDFNNSNYYYLDANNRLIGKQQRLDLGSGLLSLRNQVVSQSRYDQNMSQHPLAPLLLQTFNPKASGIDGNAWLKTIRENQYRKSQARDVRESYGLEEDSLEEDYLSNVVIVDAPNSNEGDED